MLSKLRLVRGLRRASADKIRSAQRDIGERISGNAAQLHEEATLPSKTTSLQWSSNRLIKLCYMEETGLALVFHQLKAKEFRLDIIR